MSSLSTIIKSGETRTIHTGALTGNSSKSYTAVCAADTFVAALQVRSISGNVTVTVVGLSADGEFNLVEFPTLSAATDELIIRPAGTSLSNLRIDITHSADCDIELSLKGTDVTQNTPVISLVNSSSATLSASATFTGKWENILAYSDITTFTYTSQASTLYIDFSTDGITTHRTITYSIDAATGTPHKLARIAKYMRARLTNGSDVSSSTVALQIIYSEQSKSHLTTNLSATISESSDAELMRAVLNGFTDSGQAISVPVDTNGHLEVALHSPRLPFGSVHTESLHPVFQGDAVYGINNRNTIVTTNASGSATASDSLFICQTGTTIYGAGSLQSRERLIYRAGQGMIARFTAMYTAGVANSYQVAGMGHAEDGVFFGYKGTQFGIIYNSRGKREVQTLTITTKSSTAENITVTLAGVATTVAVTNGASTITTAYEISIGTYVGWKAEAVGSTVIFVADSVGNKTGTFSITGTTVVGAFAETQAGQAVTESFIAQTEWNGDKMDGTGNSGITADWSKLNVFQIGLQYLGAGALVFQVEAAYAGNNPDWVTVHTILLPNTLTTTSFGNPSFPFTMSAYSTGSTTNLTVKVGSYMAANEGERKIHGDRQSYIQSSTSVSAGAYLPLFTIRNGRYFAGRTNQSVIKMLSVSAAIKHTSPVVIYLIKNATLTGSPNFAQFTSTSCSYIDTAATACTFSNGDLIWSGPLGDTGNIAFPFTEEIRISPGETVTMAARAVTGSPSWVVGTLNTKEFQ